SSRRLGAGPPAHGAADDARLAGPAGGPASGGVRQTSPVRHAKGPGPGPPGQPQSGSPDTAPGRRGARSGGTSCRPGGAADGHPGPGRSDGAAIATGPGPDEQGPGAVGSGTAPQRPRVDAPGGPGASEGGPAIGPTAAPSTQRGHPGQPERRTPPGQARP